MKQPDFPKEKPNILLIVCDDLGYSDLGCFGGEIATPVLDSLAENGVRMTQFYNTGRCCPSRASILTGQYPHRVGLGHMTQDIGRKGYSGSVSKDAKTIAQVLEPAGYRSFISGKWHLGTDDPTKHGFEQFYGTLVSAKRFFDADHLIRKPDGAPTRKYPEGEFYATDAVTDHALDFLKLARETPDQPWFLYLAYHAPHFPLHAPKEEIAKYADRYHGGWDKLRDERLVRMKSKGLVASETVLPPRSGWWNYGETESGKNPAWDSLPEERRIDLARRMAIYAAMIDRMDQQIGRVVADLKTKDEWENTLIIFTSDNGACAEWDPHGFDIKSSNQNILFTGDDLDKMGGPGTFHSVGSGWANAANTPWRLYKHFNHEGGINSPCIVHWPSMVDSETAGTFDRTPRHIIDLLPTFAQIAGVTTHDETLPPAGESFFSEAAPNRTLFFEHESHRAIREGNWKLVAQKDQPWELYDFSELRTEMKNLAAENPGLVKKLSTKWDVWAEENFVTPLPDDYGVGYLKPKK
ncbi:MAG: arylsulfatase [Verrucomicrobiales bacterium]|nr:arylsulfatase [Verrucomicrobiales bacterium]